MIPEAARDRTRRRTLRSVEGPPSNRAIARAVIRDEARALLTLADELGRDFDALVELLLATRGRVICSGLGKSGLVMRKVSATLSSTGTPSWFLHPTEAMHGDLGAVCADDIALLASCSGRTQEVLALAEALRERGVLVAVLTGDAASPLSQLAHTVVSHPYVEEAGILGLAPTTSSVTLLALGDALAMTVAERRGLSVNAFSLNHPGGRLGRQCAPVTSIMRPPPWIPLVKQDDSLGEVSAEMRRTGLSVVGVLCVQGRLRGIICATHLIGANPGPAGELMIQPAVLRDHFTVLDARRALMDRGVAAGFVVDDVHRPLGVVLHTDL
ncbi:MAG: SIS domain-containing protein [Alphaproteobacteria bacterium]|nr:SIS domain-containing protein [Alphaproteobacteria bacterium]